MKEEKGRMQNKKGDIKESEYFRELTNEENQEKPISIVTCICMGEEGGREISMPTTAFDVFLITKTL